MQLSRYITIQLERYAELFDTNRAFKEKKKKVQIIQKALENKLFLFLPLLLKDITSFCFSFFHSFVLVLVGWLVGFAVVVFVIGFFKVFITPYTIMQRDGSQ